MLGGFTASDTVGLVVEYAPATGETRVRFPDGVGNLQINVHFAFDVSVPPQTFFCFCFAP